MWSFTCWREGEIERNPELRAARALEELEGWPEEVCHHTLYPANALHTPNTRRSSEHSQHPCGIMIWGVWRCLSVLVGVQCNIARIP